VCGTVGSSYSKLSPPPFLAEPNFLLSLAYELLRMVALESAQYLVDCENTSNRSSALIWHLQVRNECNYSLSCLLTCENIITTKLVSPPTEVAIVLI
jgi:hypothetical protein